MEIVKSLDSLAIEDAVHGAPTAMLVQQSCRGFIQRELIYEV